MKLKDTFLTQQVDDAQFLIPMGTDGFRGIVRSNPAAAFIVDLLKSETTEDAIVSALCERYDAPREVLAKDARSVLDTLRRVGALEE